MAMDAVIAELDKQIGKMQEARRLLIEESAVTNVATTRRKFTISAASRKKMADAQRKRWAERKAKAKS